MGSADEVPRAVKAVGALRISTSKAGAPPASEPCCVAVEAPVTIEVAGATAYTILCTPSDLRALAVGFLFSEGMIGSLRDLTTLMECPDDPGVLRVSVADPSRARPRNLPSVSSCGLCGSGSIGGMLAALPTAGDSLRVPPSLLRDVSRSMREGQGLFSKTGGTHAAGIFAAGGEVIAMGEDIGRHNAMDKALGKCLLANRPTAGCGVVLSGRISFELVAKAARAGLELISAVSAPSSLAIEAAERCGITLCGFVREDRATVYSHEKRIEA